MGGLSRGDFLNIRCCCFSGSFISSLAFLLIQTVAGVFAYFEFGSSDSCHDGDDNNMGVWKCDDDDDMGV